MIQSNTEKIYVPIGGTERRKMDGDQVVITCVEVTKAMSHTARCRKCFLDGRHEACNRHQCSGFVRADGKFVYFVGEIVKTK